MGDNPHLHVVDKRYTVRQPQKRVLSAHRLSVYRGDMCWERETNRWLSLRCELQLRCLADVGSALAPQMFTPGCFARLQLATHIVHPLVVVCRGAHRPASNAGWLWPCRFLQASTPIPRRETGEVQVECRESPSAFRPFRQQTWKVRVSEQQHRCAFQCWLTSRPGIDLIPTPSSTRCER